MVLLKDVANVSGSPLGQLASPDGREILSGNGDLTFVGPIDPRDQVEKRGLPASRGPEQDKERSLFHIQIGIV
jgi:hypothetical protein